MSRTDSKDYSAEFAALFHHTYPRVLSYARTMAGADDADDAVAEAFLVAWRRFQDIPAGAELGWMIGVTRRVLSNMQRGQRRTHALQQLITRQRRPDGLDPAERVRDDALREALDRLPPLDREALILVAWFDLSTHGAATALQIRPAAFRMRLSRARRRLRSTLQEEETTAIPSTILPKEASR